MPVLAAVPSLDPHVPAAVRDTDFMRLALPRIVGGTSLQRIELPMRLRNPGTFRTLAAHVLFKSADPVRFAECVPLSSQAYRHNDCIVVNLTTLVRSARSLSATFDPSGQMVELNWCDDSRNSRRNTPVYLADGPHPIVDGLRLLRVRDIIAARMRDAANFSLDKLLLPPKQEFCGSVPPFLVRAYKERQSVLRAIDATAIELGLTRTSGDLPGAARVSRRVDPSKDVGSIVKTATKWATVDPHSPGLTLEISSGEIRMCFTFRLDGVLSKVHLVLNGERHPPIYSVISGTASLDTVIHFEELAKFALDRVSMVPAVRAKLATQN